MSRLHRITLERRRGLFVAMIMVLSLVGFAFGPVFGLFLMPLVLCTVFALGLEISRPILDDPQHEHVRARGIIALIFSFVPGLVLLFGLSLAGLTGSSFPASSAPVPLELVVFVVAGLATLLGVGLAIPHILARRGRPGVARRSRPLRWVSAVGAAWTLLFLLLQLLLWHPESSIDYLSVAYLGLVPTASILLFFLAETLRAILWPSPHTPKPGPAPSEAPTFSPYQG